MAVYSNFYPKLVALLPPGKAWRAGRDRHTIMGRVLVAMAQAFEHPWQQLQTVWREARPRTTIQCLKEWEDEYGLPDACTPIADTVYERQVAIWRKQTELGSERPADYVELAARLGYEVEIEEFEAFTTESTTDDEILSDEWAYAWRVNVLASGGNGVVRAELTTESTCDERVDGFSSFNLECVMGKANPADLVLLFSYPS